MDVRDTILDTIRNVAREQQKALGALNSEAPLLGIGLDSLCFAVLVARLEDTLGIDPFSSPEEPALPVTVGDLIEFYEHALV